MESSDIKSCVVIVANPSGRGDLGETAEGFYRVANGILTMTTPDGKTLRDDNTGRRVEIALLKGDDEKAAAKKLTLQQYRAAHRDEMAGFHRPIRYPKYAF